MASYNTIECEVAGRIAAVTLNRPDKLNAISFKMQNELVAALEEVAADPNVRVAIIQGAGKAFSAGFDITVGSTAGGGGGVPKDRANIEKLMLNWLRIWDLPIPVIGKVRGYCVAGGAQLAAICDITFAANEAKIGTPKLPLGAGFAGTIWTWFVGPKKAKEMFFPTGEIISGAEATEWGLFNRAVPDAELDEAVSAYAAKVAKTPKDILELHKKSFNRMQEIQGFREALLQGVEIDAIAHASPAVRLLNNHIKENGLQETLEAFNRGEVP